MILLGIDFGTGGCKTSAVDDGGNLLATAAVEYPTFHPQMGWSEQDPACWMPALCRTLALLRAKGVNLAAVTAVSLDGSTHNAVLLNTDMRPVRHTIMWTDQRSNLECALLKEKYGKKLFDLTFQTPAPTWTLPQLMWLAAHEPEVLKKCRHILFVKDYVRYLLTGIAATDFIEAQGTLFYDMTARNWSEEIFSLTGLPAQVLPELISPVTQSGKITPQAARETGLPEGIPVICGTSDSAAEDYGAGAIEPGDLIVKLATAGNVNLMTNTPCPGERTLTYSHVIPGMWYTVAATNQAALCARWFRDNFGNGADYDALDKRAVQSPPGSNGVFFHPYLQGERSPYWNAALRASFTGISITTNGNDIFRALLEGVAYSLRDCLRVIEEMDLPVRRLFLIGGGAKSNLWRRIVCDVFNLPLAIPVPGDASFGTALLAGAGSGVFADEKEAVKKCLKIERELFPETANAEVYRAGFGTYRSLHDALAPVYRNPAGPPEGSA